MASVLPGVDYVPAAAVEEVAFVPDVVIRPGLVFLDHRMMSIASFPVARAHESADQPPEQLVRLGKALGDELRLRALRILVRGPISLGDLAAELGVPRTTLSHHIGVLRSAGLVTMGIDDGRWGRLRLRTDGIEQAPDTFRRYLAAEGDDDVVRRMR
jgi:DNA-binding transcriptional ArsR family regulator